MFPFLDSYYAYKARAAQDEQAFAHLYDTYVEAIYRFIYVKLSSKEQAEEYTSETFLRLWQALQRGEEVRHVRGMLYRIARNLIIDEYRHRNTVPPVVGVTFSESDPSSLHEGALSDRGKDAKRMEAGTEVALLIEQIAQLKEDYQDVLTLRLMDDLSFQDIAEALEKEVGTVRVVYHRALKALLRLQKGANEKKEGDM